jgi:hypothetical protein
MSCHEQAHPRPRQLRAEIDAWPAGRALGGWIEPLDDYTPRERAILIVMARTREWP